MKTSLLNQLLNRATSPLIPHFRYHYSVDVKDWKNSFEYMKEFFECNSGKITFEGEKKMVAEISASKIFRCMLALPDLLRIDMNAADPNKVQVSVTSVGERKLYLTLFAVSVVISIIGILKKGELFALIFPLGTYGIVLKHSIYPQHMAHQKLKEIFRESNEEEVVKN